MPGSKWVFAAVPIGLLALLLIYTATLNKPAPPAPTNVPVQPTPPLPVVVTGPFTSSSQCAECHQEIYAEWQKDEHSTAWTEEKFIRFSDSYRRIECLNCHAPEPMLQVGIKTEPKLREASRSAGVDCLTCHIKDGRTVGTLGSNAPCGGKRDAMLTTSDACYHCHSAHNLFVEYLASDQYKQGMTCQDCHMTQVERAVAKGGPIRKTRLHTFHGGGHDIEAVKKALDVALKVDGGELVVTVTNVGAAHGVPGEINNRVIRLEVSIKAPNKDTGEEEELNAYRETFRAPPRLARNKVKSTQILPGEPRVMRYPLQAKTGSAEAILRFKLEHDEVESSVVELKKVELKF